MFTYNYVKQIMKTKIELFDEIIEILKKLPNRLNQEKLDSIKNIFEILQKGDLSYDMCNKTKVTLNKLVTKLNLSIEEQTFVMSRIARLCN